MKLMQELIRTISEAQPVPNQKLLDAIVNEFSHAKGWTSDMAKRIAAWLGNADDKGVDEFLYDYFYDEMPYSAKSDDPTDWIANHMSKMFASELKEDEGDMTANPDQESKPSDAPTGKVIAKADEFRIELDEDELIHLLDGEDNVRVSMPLVVWKQLTRQ